NSIRGNSGNNILDGSAGADVMRGGAGNDTYVVDNRGDLVDEVAGGGAGRDTVSSSISVDLTSSRFIGTFEIVRLSGGANTFAKGDGSGNILIGNIGNNLLDGRGGADTMAGGEGNDVYVVDNLSDKVSEAGGFGVDTILASVSRVLGSGFENLTLVG